MISESFRCVTLDKVTVGPYSGTYVILQGDGSETLIEVESSSSEKLNGALGWIRERNGIEEYVVFLTQFNLLQADSLLHRGRKE